MPPKQAGQCWTKIDAHVLGISCDSEALAGVALTADLGVDECGVCGIFNGVAKGHEIGMRGKARRGVLGTELCWEIFAAVMRSRQAWMAPSMRCSTSTCKMSYHCMAEPRPRRKGSWTISPCGTCLSANTNVSNYVLTLLLTTLKPR